MIKILLLVLFILVLLFALYIGGNILYATLTDYQPPETEKLTIVNPETPAITDSVFTFFVWNIGYAGLGEHDDFFYDGGKTVISPNERVDSYFDGIKQIVTENGQTDFILLQEVDKGSKRSYYKNEVGALGNILSQHSYSFATNYLVDFVPMPLNVAPWNAMGKVESGIASYSRYKPVEATRYAFPSKFPWPKRVYFLDRCFLLSRFLLPNGKYLVVVNTHNSAYDDDGKLKAVEMQFMKDVLLREYEKGNYIVVGGDWNQCPPNFNYQHFGKDEGDSYLQSNIPEDYLPAGWQWVYDSNTPTNRKLATPYEKGKTFVTLIDFYLVSPNVEALEVKGINIDFKYSDHQPIYLKVRLR